MRRTSRWPQFLVFIIIFVVAVWLGYTQARAHETLRGAKLDAANTSLQHALNNVQTAVSSNAQAESQSNLANWQVSQAKLVSSLQELHEVLQTRLNQESRLGNRKEKLSLQLADMKGKLPKAPTDSSTNEELAANEPNLASAANDGQSIGSAIKTLPNALF